jgi:hypothetical protein
MWFEPLDYIFGVIMGAWLYSKYCTPVLPVKVTKLPPEIEQPPYHGWRDAVQPFIRNLVVTEKFADKAVITPQGCRSIRLAIQTMATKLDEAYDKGLVQKHPNIKITSDTKFTSVS